MEGRTAALLGRCLGPDRPRTPGNKPCAQDGECQPPTGSPCPCDNIDDCLDGIVENVHNCSYQPCPAGELRCLLGGACIPHTWLCDGHPDCPASSDELGCGVYHGTSVCLEGWRGLGIR